MGDTFQKVRAGEPLQIQAETFNAFVDAARHHRQSQRSVAAETTDGSPPDSGRTRLKNQSGEDRRRSGHAADVMRLARLAATSHVA